MDPAPKIETQNDDIQNQPSEKSQPQKVEGQDLNPENSSEISGSADPGLFKNDFEKNLYKRIHDIRKYFSSIDKFENYDESLKTLSLAKNEIDAFFDNVIVNDNDPSIKKNRLELLKMLCKSFENYFNFSKIEA